jgi:hypothetical protein
MSYAIGMDAHQLNLEEMQMTTKKMDWTPDLSLPTGKGATMERFTATDGKDQLEIDTTPWGEGDLKINNKAVVHVADDPNGGEAFRDLEAIAEEIEAQKAGAVREAGPVCKKEQT